MIRFINLNWMFDFIALLLLYNLIKITENTIKIKKYFMEIKNHHSHE